MVLDIYHYPFGDLSQHLFILGLQKAETHPLDFSNQYLFLLSDSRFHSFRDQDLHGPDNRGRTHRTLSLFHLGAVVSSLGLNHPALSFDSTNPSLQQTVISLQFPFAFANDTESDLDNIVYNRHSPLQRLRVNQLLANGSFNLKLRAQYLLLQSQKQSLYV